MKLFSVIYYQVGRLHCLLPWWEDAMVNFMLSGGYNVVHQIKKVFSYLYIAMLYSLYSVKIYLPENFCI